MCRSEGKTNVALRILNILVPVMSSTGSVTHSRFTGDELLLDDDVVEVASFRICHDKRDATNQSITISYLYNTCIPS